MILQMISIFEIVVCFAVNHVGDLYTGSVWGSVSLRNNSDGSGR